MWALSCYCSHYGRGSVCVGFKCKRTTWTGNHKASLSATKDILPPNQYHQNRMWFFSFVCSRGYVQLLRHLNSRIRPSSLSSTTEVLHRTSYMFAMFHRTLFYAQRKENAGLGVQETAVDLVTAPRKMSMNQKEYLCFRTSKSKKYGHHVALFIPFATPVSNSSCCRCVQKCICFPASHVKENCFSCTFQLFQCRRR
jgi:hypothetical protein